MTGEPGATQAPEAACPSCGALVGAGDSFCESCGTELAPPMVSAAPPGYEAECPVCSVDPEAPPGAITAEGYCESCGRKVPSGRDHSELDLGLLAGVTDRGLRHARNEDAMALATADAPGGPMAIAVVCDGVSTSPRPDDASLSAAQASVRTLLTSVRRGDDPAEASLAAVYSAHHALARMGSPGDAPSATYISAVIGGDAVTVCWLGDSRAYWLSTGPDLMRLSTDDSLAEELVSRGTMDEAQALASPQAHVITRWLGADLAEPEPHVVRFEPPGPGVVLVCSDGLWNYRPEAAGLAELALPAALTDPLGAAAELVKFALDAGGMDNITVVLAPFPLAPFPDEPPHPKTVPVGRVATLAMVQSAMGKQVADVALREWTPRHATVKFVKQVAPTVDDLIGRRSPSGPQAGDYPTGAWGPGESRGQAELAAASQDGLEARKQGAMRKPRRPSWAGPWRWLTSRATRTRPSCWPRWSTSSTWKPGRSGCVSRSRTDEMALDTRSTKTVRARK